MTPNDIIPLSSPLSTFKRTDCVEYGVDATINIDAVTIPSDAVLNGVDGKSYYAKSSRLLEYYPEADDTSICDDLSFDDLPERPDFVSVYEEPANAEKDFPDDEQKASLYLKDGKPVVVGGVVMI